MPNPPCPICHSPTIRGGYGWRGGKKVRRYQCTRDGHKFTPK